MKKNIAKGSLVLYADDDADDRLFMELGFLPYPELKLRSFHDALALLSFLPAIRTEDIGAIILDNDMPCLTGIETIRKLRGLPQLEQVPLILFTTCLSIADRICCESLNARCFIKPCGLSEQAAVINEIISDCCLH